jgi:hypothetical protein
MVGAIVQARGDEIGRGKVMAPGVFVRDGDHVAAGPPAGQNTVARILQHGAGCGRQPEAPAGGEEYGRIGLPRSDIVGVLEDIEDGLKPQDLDDDPQELALRPGGHGELQSATEAGQDALQPGHGPQVVAQLAAHDAVAGLEGLLGRDRQAGFTDKDLQAFDRLAPIIRPSVSPPTSRP